MNGDYNEYKTYGKNAEDVFRFLINSMPNWKVIDYGVEQHVETLRQNIKGIYDEITDKIRHMPDFVVINEKEKKVLFFEVKRLSFIDKRKQGELLFSFQKNIIEKYIQGWKEAKLFIIHQENPYFYSVDLKDIDIVKHKQSGDIFVNEDNAQNNKRPMNKWNFKDIAKSVKETFPELDDKVIKKAQNMILHYKPKENSLD